MPTQKGSSRKRGRHGKGSWLPLGIIALLVAAVVGSGVFLTQRRGGEPAAPAAAVAARELAAAGQIALPSTAGGEMQLERLHGSKVVLYFYEGSG